MAQPDRPPTLLGAELPALEKVPPTVRAMSVVYLLWPSGKETARNSSLP